MKNKQKDCDNIDVTVREINKICNTVMLVCAIIAIIGLLALKTY